MKLYTSYFANVKKLPTNLLPIAICGKSISGWSYPEYKKLAPSWSIYNEHKLQGGTKERYIQRYNEEILEKLDPHQVIEDLNSLSSGYDGVVLICYEKPGDFCHRHLVSNWFNENGYKSEEI